MCILTDKSADIWRCCLTFEWWISRKQWVEFLNECLLATHQVDQSFYIVRYKPSPLPRCSFTIIIIAMSRCTRIERGAPFTFRVKSTHEAGWFIEIEFVCFGKTLVFGFGLKIIHCFCKNRNAPVIIRILQRFSYGFIFTVAGNITNGILIIFRFRHEMRQYQVRAFDTGSIIFGCTQTGLIGFFCIEIAIPFHISIHYDGDSMITDHGTGIVGSQIPQRVYSAFLLLLYQWIDKLIIQIGIDNRH